MDKKNRDISILFILVCVLFIFSVSKGLAQDELFIYPKDGQSEEQQEKDKFACYSWAKKESKFDPMEIPRASSAPPDKKATTKPLRRAARGAAIGAIVGEIADDDAGKGALIGASSGALFGGMQRRDQEQRQKKKEEEWEKKEAQKYQKKRDSYNRAYSACLEAKGYTVK